VKNTHTLETNDFGVRRRPSLVGPTRRRIPQLGVDALGVVVGDIVLEDSRATHHTEARERERVLSRELKSMEGSYT
jgi:hypothetical protein